jgi:hypothetical protein
MNIRKETYVPPLIRPSGTFSHREKALTTPSLSTGRGWREAPGEGSALVQRFPNH